MFDEKFFDSYLVELVNNDYGYQTAEVFLDQEGHGIARQAVLVRIDPEILRLYYKNRDDILNVEERVEKDLDELGIPSYTVRGAKEMVRISKMIMDNEFFADSRRNIYGKT